MRIIIETTESEQVALRQEKQPMATMGASTGSDVATDGGPPREDLLQSLGERFATATASPVAETERPYTLVMPGAEPPPSRH